MCVIHDALDSLERVPLQTCLSDLGLDEINGIITASVEFDDSMPFTLFAPTDEMVQEAGVSDENAEDFLLAHVVSEKVFGNQFSNGQRLPGIVSGTAVHITIVKDHDYEDHDYDREKVSSLYDRHFSVSLYGSSSTYLPMVQR